MSEISQRLEQKQKFNPRQILEANLMQLSIWNLERRIVEEIENNPTLDIVEEEEENLENETTDESEFNWEDLISNPEDYSLSNNKNTFDSYQNAHQLSITEDFILQLNDLNIKGSDLDVAELILGNLDDRGYLVIEPILIADKLLNNPYHLDSLILIQLHLNQIL
jgi:RNA polymerase sigma-54 factor